MGQVQPKRTILIVDDQEIDRIILMDFLKSEYELLTATNGKEALDVLHEKADTLSAVLLDIVMPVMDGYEVLRAMSEDELLAHVPVLVTSEQDGDESEG